MLAELNHLVANENIIVVHAGGNGADDDASFVVGSMDHLTITDINAGMVGVNHNIAGLRIGHTGPTHEVDRGAQTAVASCEAIAYKTGAVKAVRSNAAPRIRIAELAVGARNNGTAVNGLARCRRRRSRSRSGRRGLRSGRGRVSAVVGRTATLVGVLGRTGGVVAHRGLFGGASINASLQRSVGLGLGSELGLQLRIQGVYDVLGFSLLGIKLVDLLLRGGDVLLLLGLLIGELLLKLLDLLNGLSLLIGNFAVVEQTVEHIAQIIDTRQNLKQAQTAGFVLAGDIGRELGLTIGDLLLLLRDLATDRRGYLAIPIPVSRS